MTTLWTLLSWKYNPKELLWTTLSDLEWPIGADSSSINKEFFTVSFFAKLNLRVL